MLNAPSPGNTGVVGKRERPRVAGRSVPTRLLASWEGRIQKSMQKSQFSTPPLALQKPRGTEISRLSRPCPFLTSCARPGLAQDSSRGRRGPAASEIALSRPPGAASLAAGARRPRLLHTPPSPRYLPTYRIPPPSCKQHHAPNDIPRISYTLFF